MTFRCAIVGVSGGRANGHAEAFAHMPRGMLTSVSTRNPENLHAFGERWGVTRRHEDYERMFAEERPDLVLVNTPPDVRLTVMESAARNGVKGLIVEKPLAMQGEDYLALADFHDRTELKVAINHQLHFHPRRQQLQGLVAGGAIGKVRSIRASARMNMAYQGTHVLQAIQAFQPNPAQSVKTSLMEGAAGLRLSPKMHLAPDQLAAEIAYADGSAAFLECGTNAPHDDEDDDRINVHKMILVEGSEGHVRWSMTGWRTVTGDCQKTGRHVYGEEDILGQAAMCEAMFDWIEDDARVHPLNLSAALYDFRLLLAVYASGLSGKPEGLEDPPPLGLLQALRTRLRA